MKTLTYAEIEEHRKQIVEESITWHRANNVNDEKRLDDFRAGFEAGWGAAIADLRLHGYKFGRTVTPGEQRRGRLDPVKAPA